MSRILYIILVSLILTGCATSKKYFAKGEYDNAINLAVAKIRKNPSSEKDIIVLEKAYPIANTKDNDRIKYLRLEGKPDVWDEIFSLYTKLSNRQSLVKTVLPISFGGRTINFEQVNYDQEIVKAKSNAAEYFYVHAKKLMESNSKQDYRTAYYEFLKVKKYYSSYLDVDDWIKKSKELGVSFAYVKVVDNTIFKLPEQFMKNIIGIDLLTFNSEWIHYTDQAIYKNDYTLVINLKKIDVSPESIKEEKKVESRDIQDGWNYQLDSKGNVMKDSLGNDIKTPKYKKISCTLITTRMSKAAHIDGTIEYYSVVSNQVIKTVPIAADNLFSHKYAIALGELDALSPESKKHLGDKPIPFPPDMDMIIQSSETLKGVIAKAIRDNHFILK